MQHGSNFVQIGAVKSLCDPVRLQSIDRRAGVHYSDVAAYVRFIPITNPAIRILLLFLASKSIQLTEILLFTSIFRSPRAVFLPTCLKENLRVY